MFKKILVLGVLSTALVGLTTACNVDATGDTAAATGQDLSTGLTSDPGTYTCTASGYCECHDRVGCDALQSKCGGSWSWYCSDGASKTDCCCIMELQTTPTSPVRQVTAGTGTRLVR